MYIHAPRALLHAPYGLGADTYVRLHDHGTSDTRRHADTGFCLFVLRYSSHPTKFYWRQMMIVPGGRKVRFVGESRNVPHVWGIFDPPPPARPSLAGINVCKAHVSRRVCVRFVLEVTRYIYRFSDCRHALLTTMIEVLHVSMPLTRF